MNQPLNLRQGAADRYRDDPAFKSLVQVLLSQIREAKYTPTEIREAAMFAQILYEETTLRPLMIDVVRLEINDPRYR